ncbi:MAG: membrane protein insertion efficiency factor YidD [Acidobacteria bacterium]|nr:membrane protein insertion efficiency factor YidD [Acidobacteriota bacterium]
MLAADARLPAAERPSTHFALASIHLYQQTLSRLYARAGVQCRFTPTCSHFAEASVGGLGVWRGGWLAAKRVLRCGPWTPAGTVDPPPGPARTIVDRLR